MFIYLVIAAEAAIFFTAFWYIYVREPKPLNMLKNPRKEVPGLTAGGIDPTLPFFTPVNTGSALAVKTYAPDSTNPQVTLKSHWHFWLASTASALMSFTRTLARLPYGKPTGNNQFGDNALAAEGGHLERLSLHRHCRKRSHTVRLFP